MSSRKSTPKAKSKAKPASTVPPIVYAEPPRFDGTSEEQMIDAVQYLRENGYVVISNALDFDGVVRAREMLWNWLENDSGFPISRSDPKTWYQWPKWADSGVIPTQGIGHSELLWFVRSAPVVKQTFSQIWGTENLIVSFDGAGVFRPWHYEPKWKTAGSWFHADQNGNLLPGFACVQGMVSLFDQTDSTGGLVVVPTSHKRFADITRHHARQEGHFVKLHGGWDSETLHDLQPTLVGSKAGDLILWDSRTVHCNTSALSPPIPPEDGEQWNLLRAVAYVCMTPRSNAKHDVLQIRRDAVEKRITTSHWPHYYYPNHAAIPGDGPQLTEYQRNLV